LVGTLCLLLQSKIKYYVIQRTMFVLEGKFYW